MKEEKEIAIRLMADINQQTIASLMNLVESNLNSGVKQFRLLLSSNGGSVHHGITAYNFLKGIPAKIITHNIGSIDSIATVVFCAGDERQSVPNGRFFMHSVTWGSNAPVCLEEKQLKEILSGLKIDRENISKIVADNCKKDSTEIEEIMLNGKMFSPDEAKEFGLITRISEVLLPNNVPVIGIN